jgi:adenylate cyclase
MERRLAAILAADVVGYSRMMGLNEARTLAALKSYRRELIDCEITARGGRVIGTKGDSVLAEFVSAVSAVECAIAIQNGIAIRNQDVPADERFEYRIGINLDEILEDENDIFGNGVNIAARLEGFAEVGAICVSSAVFDQVKNRVSCGFDDLGAQQFKNIAEPVRVFRVNASTSAAMGFKSTPGSDHVPCPSDPRSL